MIPDPGKEARAISTISTVNAEGYYEQVEQAGLELSDISAPGATFLDCRLSSSTIGSGDLEGSTWRGGTLTGVRFVGTGLARSIWHGLVLEGCALAGVELFGSHWKRVRLVGGMLQGVNLRQAHLENVVFEDCVLRDVDLAGARLDGVSFPGCRIERADLTGMKARRVDLRGAAITISRGVGGLRGVVVDQAQVMDLAQALAAELGITVLAAGEPL